MELQNLLDRLTSVLAEDPPTGLNEKLQQLRWMKSRWYEKQDLEDTFRKPPLGLAWPSSRMFWNFLALSSEPCSDSDGYFIKHWHLFWLQQLSLPFVFQVKRLNSLQSFWCYILNPKLGLKFAQPILEHQKYFHIFSLYFYLHFSKNPKQYFVHWKRFHLPILCQVTRFTEHLHQFHNRHTNNKSARGGKPIWNSDWKIPPQNNPEYDCLISGALSEIPSISKWLWGNME